MPSDFKKAKAAAKKTNGRKKKGAAANGKLENGDNEPKLPDQVKTDCGVDSDDIKSSGGSVGDACDLLSGFAMDHRTVTSVLTSHPKSRDLQYISVSMNFHGQELLTDTKLELNNGRRYGLIGLNGCGKSSLLAVLATEQIPIPEHIDHYLLQREMEPSDKTALESVMEADEERSRLEHEAEMLALECDDEDANERLMEVYERLDSMDADTAAKRAGELLHGLGFTPEMQKKQVKHFSGGWRMRISLARALFLRPALLMLDEPTNHLDMNACVWLERELAQYSRILIIISHSEDFLNGVCTNIIHFHDKVLKFYSGNYNTYIQTRWELEENQMKRFKSEQDDIAKMKDYVARFGHGSKKMARQAQSKEKTIKKMEDKGLTKRVTVDRTLSFVFPDPGHIPPPVIQIQNVSFRYHEDKPYIYKDLDFGIDMDTCVALVGPNGAGKSTLLKLIGGELEPTEGLIRRHSHVKIGRYHQHLHEILNMDVSSLDWMMQQFPNVKERDEMRKRLGRYGLSGAQQVCKIRVLSDGQRCRIIFAWLAETAPHMLLLDEPTNHLDLETIDALAEALIEFEGGVLLVSHDFRLIDRVTDTIWLCDKGTVTKWDGGVMSFKKHLRSTINH